MSQISQILADLNLDVGDANLEDIVTVLAYNSDTLQSWEMAPLFPGQPQYHVATSARSALILLGCVETEDS